MYFTCFLSVLLAALAYLLGSVCCAIWVCRLMRLPDPRTQGSGNPGATNVKRLGGTQAALLTLLGDAFKGWLPVFLALQFQLPEISISLIFLAAFLGHLFPIFFEFKGGKGVATALGGMFGLEWVFGLLVGITWLVGYGLFRVSALGALFSMTLAPFYHFWLFRKVSYLVLLLAITLCLFWTHRSNLRAFFR